MKAIHMKYQPKPTKPKEEEQSLNSSDKKPEIIEAIAYSKGKWTPEMEERLSKFFE